MVYQISTGDSAHSDPGPYFSRCLSDICQSLHHIPNLPISARCLSDVCQMSARSNQFTYISQMPARCLPEQYHHLSLPDVYQMYRPDACQMPTRAVSSAIPARCLPDVCKSLNNNRVYLPDACRMPGRTVVLLLLFIIVLFGLCDFFFWL